MDERGGGVLARYTPLSDTLHKVRNTTRPLEYVKVR